MREKRLLSNTVFLYILTFSNYFFSFITVPYQTRVLGPVFYGRLGFAAAFMMYIQLFIDFGFIMSATERVSKNREDKDKVSKIFTVITYCKLILTTISGIAVIFLCLISKRFSGDILVFFLYFISTVMLSFFPDYVYRGLENMKAITIRNVLIKLFPLVNHDGLVLRNEGLHDDPCQQVGHGTDAEDDHVAAFLALKAHEREGRPHVA